jgi:hypothetical protein
MRMPEDKEDTMEELLEDPKIAEGWEEYQDEMERRAAYFTNGGQYELQNPVVDGSNVGNENDLSMLFIERVFNLANKGSYIAQILPGTVFLGASGKDVRMHMLQETCVNDLVLFENHGIFQDLHGQYRFGVSVIKNSGETKELNTYYSSGDSNILRSIEEFSVSVPQEILINYSPKARTFPLVRTERQVEILKKIISHQPLGEQSAAWNVTPYRELDRNQDADRFIENDADGDYPVYGGSNIHQYKYTPDFIPETDAPSLWSVDEEANLDLSAKRRIREKVIRSRDPQLGLKKAIYQEFGGSGSQKSFVNDLLQKHRGRDLSLDDVKLDCTEYRIVFRNITNHSNERTMICSVIPKGIVCHHALNTIRPYEFDITEENMTEFPLHSVYNRVFTDKELFVAVGMLNSIPFDYLMRTKIDENLVMYKLTESQMPRLTEGDSWFNYIWERAAKLNCYGEKFEEMRERLDGIEPVSDQDERRRLEAEIDAAAFHAYGLNKSDTSFILDDFHKVSNPRIMTEEYFDQVREKYDELAETGPHH